MIASIRTHNEVNGFLFSAIEFALMAICIFPFGVYYFLHQRVEAGLVATGIVANCLTVVAFAVHSMLAGHKDLGVMHWFNKKGRLIIAARYGDVTPDTLRLTVATVIPFAVLIVTLYDLVQDQRTQT